VSYIEKMTLFLAEHKDEPEIIIDQELLSGYAKEMMEGYEAGKALAEARQAVRTARINARLLDTLDGFWRDVVSQPVLKPQSFVGLQELIRQCLATSRALIPPTMAMPADSVFEVAMLALMLRVKDYTR
jgi:hypothetical protein